ncbi:amino acid permease [Bordetella avium]|nr:amino acid permease [Bordetella avium]AZY51379.1 amino acid permease [Bordetella avium]RIQ14768.1 amino acid permease [Bordetella avium]RIQ18749.1 amino acid permease [Bordetella avium]RIQ35216.1 amino acid permease [Bordetella avium]
MPKTSATMMQQKQSGRGGQKLGLISCVAFAVGSMVGGGVFAMAGVAVNMAGPGALLAYLLAGIVVGFSALSFAVVASRAPEGESGYTPVGVELGQIWQFITMWAFYVSTVTAVAFMLIAFGNYLQYFFSSVDALLVALVGLLALVLLNLTSVGVIGKAESLMVGFKLLVLFAMIGFGLAAFSGERLTPFFPKGEMPVLSTAAMLFSAYLGFSVITNMAGVVKNPQKTVPRALMLSIGVVAVVYIGITFALLMADVGDLGDAGLAKAAEVLMGKWGAWLVALAACISTLSGSNATLLGVSELMIGMAAKGYVPSFMGRMSRAGHAQMSVLIAGAVACVLMLTGDIASIITYCSVAGIWALIMMDITACRIAWKRWGPIGLRLPFGGLIPALAAIAAAAQLPSLGWEQVLIGTAMVAAGFLIYALRHRSDPKERETTQAQIAAQQTPLLRHVQGAQAAEHDRGAAS